MGRGAPKNSVWMTQYVLDTNKEDAVLYTAAARPRLKKQTKNIKQAKTILQIKLLVESPQTSLCLLLQGQGGVNMFTHMLCWRAVSCSISLSCIIAVRVLR